MAQEKTFLVTGAAGFIGARMVEELLASRHRVISVDHLNYFDERREHRALEFGLKIERDELFQWLERENPKLDGIVHLGACTDTTEMNEEYLERVNVRYSQSLWLYASRRGIPLVYASSAATYGDGAQGYEDDENKIAGLRALNPYGESKRRFDLWALDQEKSGVHPPSWSGFKFFNVYGFGERHKDDMASVVLKAYDQILSTGKVRLFQSHRPGIGDGEQKRDFIAVQDVVRVLFFALEKPIRRGVFNLGTGQARSFFDLVRAVFHELKTRPEIEFFPMPPSIRDQYQYFTEARMEKLRREGYEGNFLSLEEGVHLYVERLEKTRGPH